jgi:hypothetical protein
MESDFVNNNRSYKIYNIYYINCEAFNLKEDLLEIITVY